MLSDKKNLFWIILASFLLIPLIVSVISSIHVINFFELSNFKSLAIALSVSFEIGALSALAGLVVMDKINKNVIYFIFIVLTAYQMMGNTYYAYDMLSEKMMTNPNLINNWTELFGFDIEDTILMKRIIAIISGAILPIVSLCFLDLSVDYIKKSLPTNEDKTDNSKKKILTDESENKEIIISDEQENIQDETTTQNQIVNEVQDVNIEEQIEVITEEEKKEVRENVVPNQPLNQSPNQVPITPRMGFHNVVFTR